MHNKSRKIGKYNLNKIIRINYQFFIVKKSKNQSNNIKYVAKSFQTKIITCKMTKLQLCSTKYNLRFWKKKSSVHFYTLNVIRSRRRLLSSHRVVPSNMQLFFRNANLQSQGGGGVGMREKQAVYYFNLIFFFFLISNNGGRA